MSRKKSTILNALQGMPGKRSVRPEGVRFAALQARPRAPRYMSAAGKKIWKEELMPALETGPVGYVQVVDVWELAALCDMMAMYRRIISQIDDDGPLVERTKTSGDVEWMPSGALRALGDIWPMIDRICDRYGLHPISRERIVSFENRFDDATRGGFLDARAKPRADVVGDGDASGPVAVWRDSDVG